jgi:hypothetical protein
MLCGGKSPLVNVTVSPAEIVISLGSNTKLPPEPIWISAAHAKVGMKITADAISINQKVCMNVFIM